MNESSLLCEISDSVRSVGALAFPQLLERYSQKRRSKFHIQLPAKRQRISENANMYDDDSWIDNISLLDSILPDSYALGIERIRERTPAPPEIIMEEALSIVTPGSLDVLENREGTNDDPVHASASVLLSTNPAYQRSTEDSLQRWSSPSAEKNQAGICPSIAQVTSAQYTSEQNISFDYPPEPSEQSSDDVSVKSLNKGKEQT